MNGSMSSYFGVFDEKMTSHNEKASEPSSRKQTESLFTLLGSNNQYTSGTYKALLERPELFGNNACTLLYALDVGLTLRKESLYTMFESFLHKAPTNVDANVIMTWADTMKRLNITMDYEPVLAKLNVILSEWFADKTVMFDGKKVAIDKFRPIAYNHSGVNVIDMLPYIAYIFTYHIYGYPFTFSDVYASSSLKNYYDSLEQWFAKCYGELYKEQGIDEDNRDIDDETWKSFYATMLEPGKIIELRNYEINKTEDMLQSMISSQQRLNDDDLRQAYNFVMTRLVQILDEQSPFVQLMRKWPVFTSEFVDPVDLVALTTYYATKCDKPLIIEDYGYVLSTKDYKPIDERLSFKPSFKFTPLTLCLNRPLTGADIIAELYRGLLKQRFDSKRMFQMDSTPIYITPSDMDLDGLYGFVLSTFVNGSWINEYSSMKAAFEQMKSQPWVTDLFNLRETLTLIHGNNLSTMGIPIYVISMINMWLYDHCNASLDLKSFNPYVYCRHSSPDIERINKITSMMYSFMFMNNESYVNLANSVNSYLYEVITSSPIIVQPHVQAFDDQSTIYMVGGCDTYKYAKMSNPFVRGYHFIRNVVGSDEEFHQAYLFCSMVQNETVFELINETSIRDTLSTYAIRNSMTVPSLDSFKFDQERYARRDITDFVGITENDEYVVSILMRYAMKRTTTELATHEEVRVKRYSISPSGTIDASIPSQVNGFTVNGNGYTVKLASSGDVKEIPVCNMASTVATRALTIINPNGKSLVQIKVPDTSYNDSNKIFWVFTNVKPKSKFVSAAESTTILEPKPIIRSSGYHPNSAQYMLSDRVQPIPRV